MERYSFNPVAKTLVITAAFAKAIQDINSEEYALYTQLMADIPNLEVIRKTHKTPSKYQTKTGEKFSCNQFKNLTYKNMETFIMGLPAAEAYMEEYLFLKNYAAEVQTNLFVPNIWNFQSGVALLFTPLQKGSHYPHITADGIVGKPASPHRHNKQLQVFSCQVIERHPQVQMLPNTMEVPTIGFQRFFADPLRGF